MFPNSEEAERHGVSSPADDYGHPKMDILAASRPHIWEDTIGESPGVCVEGQLMFNFQLLLLFLTSDNLTSPNSFEQTSRGLTHFLLLM